MQAITENLTPCQARRIAAKCYTMAANIEGEIAELRQSIKRSAEWICQGIGNARDNGADIQDAYEKIQALTEDARSLRSDAQWALLLTFGDY